jgi:hypothetical protein
VPVDGTPGLSRWIIAGLTLLGSVLLGITGTLGGHLVGIYTEVSNVMFPPALRSVPSKAASGR